MVIVVVAVEVSVRPIVVVVVVADFVAGTLSTLLKVS